MQKMGVGTRFGAKKCIPRLNTLFVVLARTPFQSMLIFLEGE